MAFVGVDVARRIERAERALIEDSTVELGRAGAEVLVLPLAGGVAACSGVDSPLTKVAGLGFEGVPTGDDLARVEREFHARGAAVQVELASLAEASVTEALSARGYVLAGFENLLMRTLRPDERWPDRPEISIERSGADTLDGWLDTLVSAFASPDAQGVVAHESFPRAALERVVRAMSGARGTTRYLARRDGVVAGSASLRVDTAMRVAQLCGAGTLPEHRRRGVQRALLERRLADAARAGCELAVVTTAPGSKSQENAQRAGFELAYVRAILRLPPAASR
ncbi:MAG: GNAT family N-acetyltransferase [Planctomycetes bacterium]|nr:GNAT family N-acetyltransferase [Planctomycetota bacterium]